jgi:hypothetical protein
MVFACLLCIGAFRFQWQDGYKPDFPDVDMDGVPDHSDFCSSPHSATGWTSGRVTDFDSDGCRDGVEDLDRDNDGVNDSSDLCTKTPLQYGFISNYLSDFDGDGCADSLEDSDDDGDQIPDKIDKCQSTEMGETSDGTGCSAKQILTTTTPKDGHGRSQSRGLITTTPKDDHNQLWELISSALLVSGLCFGVSWASSKLLKP